MEENGKGEKGGVLFIKKGKKPVISGVGIGILCAPFSFRVRSDGSILKVHYKKRLRFLQAGSGWSLN